MKSILITGTSTGIGKACALLLDSLGYQVIAGVRKNSDGEALKAQSSSRLAPLILDITDMNSIADAVQIMESNSDNQLSALVNNAGIAFRGPLEYIPVIDFRKQLEVNLIGQLALTQACMPLLRSGQGRILFIGSASGRLPPPFLGPYAVAKSGLEMVSNTLRLELRPWGLHVSILICGSVVTPIWQHATNTAHDLSQSLPPTGQQQYQANIEASNVFYDSLGHEGLPADVVARKVARILTVRNPRSCYLVGKDAWIYTFIIRFFPTFVREWITLREMRLT